MKVNGLEVLFGKTIAWSDVGKYRKGNDLDNQHANKPIDQRPREADANHSERFSTPDSSLGF